MSKVKPNLDEEKQQQLQTLLEAAKAARPSPADEERMVALVVELLTGNKASVTLGVESLLKMQWNPAVKAATEAWPKVKATGRKQILAALEAESGEEARRIRLSLSRGLVTIDPESAHKILQGVCAALLPEAESTLGNKDKQGIFNVLIGKGKPWLQHLDLAAWDAEAQGKLAQCILQAAPISAPFTQEAILRWAVGLNVLEKLSKPTTEMVITMLNRWPGKLRKELDKITLPEAITAQLKAAPEPQKPQQPPRKAPAPEAGAPAEELAAPEAETPAGDSTELSAPEAAESPRPRQRPEKVVPRTTVVTVTRQPVEPRQQQAPQRAQEFDLNTSLRQIEQYVQKLRKDLKDAQSNREREPRGRKREGEPKIVSGAEVEHLLRHNAQLEATVTELRERISDLVQDHEDRAVTLEEGDPLAQFEDAAHAEAEGALCRIRRPARADAERCAAPALRRSAGPGLRSVADGGCEIDLRVTEPPAMEGACALCDRLEKLTRHHLIPQARHHNKRNKREFSRREVKEVAWICRPCHSQIHNLFTEKELERNYRTLEALRGYEELAKFIEWIKTKPSGFRCSMRKAHERS
ncbi:MAG: hypothetical protein QM796_07905 [Chthoniobacteraceae bacterium]